MSYFRLVALVLAVNLCAAGRAQDHQARRGTHTVSAEGTEAFRDILHQFHLKPITSLTKLKAADPAETLIVVFGTNDILETLRTTLGGLKHFTARGGAVLIATDRDSRLGLQELNLAISGIPVVDEHESYRGLALCPRLFEGLKKEHPLFDSFRSTGLATNHPSFLRRLAPVPLSGFDVIARFGSQSMPLIRQRPEEFKKLKQPLAYMIAGRDPDRVLVIAGHGIFMNMLLAQSDNDNMTFAFNCVRWLAQGRDGGKRTQALVVENGRIVNEFDTGLTGPPRLPLPPTQVLNHMIRGLEKENFFNRLLAEFVTRERILQGVLLVCSLLLLVYCAWRLMGARHRSEGAIPLLAGPSPAVERGILTRREQAMKETGNFTEAAAGLVRGFFAEYAPYAVRDTQPYQKREPPFSAVGPWPGRLLLMRQVSYLWRIGRGESGPTSARQLKQLPLVLDRVAAAIQQGRLVVKARGETCP